MGFLSRLLESMDSSSSKREGRQSLERRLAELEDVLDRKPLGIQGSMLNQAGDLCQREGDGVRAVGYFARAIDRFLRDEQPEAARGVARKIIRVHPEAIRTRSTLTWVDLSSRHFVTAAEDLRDYVRAARRGRREGEAVEEVLEMGRMVDDRGFLRAVSEALEELEAPRAAREVREGLKAGGSREASVDPAAFREGCLRRAVDSNARKDGRLPRAGEGGG